MFLLAHTGRVFQPHTAESDQPVKPAYSFNSVRFKYVVSFKLGVNLELNVVNGMQGHPCLFIYYQLMSVRCLVTGKYAELKRQDGMSEEP